jgi:hypothetical protein
MAAVEHLVEEIRKLDPQQKKELFRKFRDFKDTINTHKCLISIDSIGVCAKCVP